MPRPASIVVSYWNANMFMFRLDRMDRLPVIVDVSLLFFLLNYSFDRAKKRREDYLKHQYDYIPPKGLSFEEKLKSAKMIPDNHILYGQNEFARDCVIKCVFVQSSKVPEGMLVHYKDIISFELVRDGETIAGRPVGNAGTNITQMNISSNEDVPIDKKVCSELQLKISIKNKSNPVIIMPFIFFPVKEANYRYALNTAYEIVGILNEILLLETEEKEKGQKNKSGRLSGEPVRNDRSQKVVS